MADLMTELLPLAAFECVAGLATLHDVPLAGALARLAGVLAPGRMLLVLDLDRARRPVDALWAAAAPAAWGPGLRARGARARRGRERYPTRERGLVPGGRGTRGGGDNRLLRRAVRVLPLPAGAGRAPAGGVSGAGSRRGQRPQATGSAAERAPGHCREDGGPLSERHRTVPKR